jgi:uncharacterized protein (DUF2344 family)
MNARYRLAITKGEEVRYVSHLDYMRSIERAIRGPSRPPPTPKASIPI